MADLKLVGAVAIKVRPDATGFRREAQKELDKELKGVKATVPVEAELDEGKVEEDTKKLEKKLSGKQINWKVKLDHDSVRAAQQQFDSMLEPTKKISFKLGNTKSIAEAAAKLEKMAAKAEVKITYAQDEKGYQSVLAKIAEIRRQKLEKPIKFKTDKASLDKLEKEMLEEIAKLGGGAGVEVKAQSTIKFEYNENREGLEAVIADIKRELGKFKDQTIYVDANKDQLLADMAAFEKTLSNLPVTFKYDNNKAGLEKVIAEIDAELAKHQKVEVETFLKPSNLAFTKARLEEELGHQTVHIDYEADDLSSLKAARARILALLPASLKTHITTELNEASVLEALAKIDAMIKAATPETKVAVAVKPKASVPDFLKVAAAIGVLTRDQTVGVFVKLNNAGILLAATKLTGLRAAARWSEELGKSLGTLDRNLPIVAAVTLGLTQLSGTITNLAAGAFSLGNDLGQVVRMAALLGPALILGFAAVKTVMQGVFKDFGAAVNGDSKAIEKLTESGKQAAANMRVIFQDIRETVSKNFWAEAGDNMLEFSKTALPAVRDGMGQLSTSMGGVFASIIDATSKFAKEDGFLVFFSNLTRGFANVKDGMGPFMAAFLNLAALGSTIFPRMGTAFDNMSVKFDAWVKGLAADGTFSRWIDMGVQGIKDLWSAGMSLIKVWENIGTVAQASGAMTLQSFAGLMAKLQEITAGASFQRNLSNIFKGAREGSENFKESLKDVGPVMDTFSLTVKNALALSGAAFGAFAKDAGDLFSSSNLDKGMTAFLTGIKVMFEQLRPAMAPVSEILRTFGEVLGQVATDSGPLFTSLFTQLASVLTTAWAALQPFLPALIQIGTSILDILGPALTTVASTLIPAFASGLQDVGDGLVPIIKYVSDLAVGFVGWVSSMPTPLVIGLATGILTLGSAFKFMTSIVPLATTLMTAWGNSAAIAGIKAQLMVPVIGLLLAGLAALVAGSITEFATQQANATPYANDYAQALREDADAAKELGHVVQSSQIRTAIKELFDSGAYDNAAKLGISTKMLTDAVVKGGPALTEIKNRIKEANKVWGDAVIASSAAGDAATSYGDKYSKVTPEILANKAAGEKLNEQINQNRDSSKKASSDLERETEIRRAAGIEVEDQARKMALLNEAMDKLPGVAGKASAASRTLTDAFASSAAKVDAMRTTFDLLVGKDPKQQIAETLGAYVTGFNNLKETVTPLAGKMRELGEAVYGETGFLNVAGGNKAVLTVNQSLVDEVNNIWAGAKATYDAAIKQGDNATQAFQKARTFIDERHGDFDQLATDSGVAADRVQGQWKAIFGEEWVLKVSLNGLTEVTAKAQAMVQLLGGSFDGKAFLAYLDANPDEALKAFADADGVAQRWMSNTFRAKIGAYPDEAEDQIRRLIGMTEDEWEKADFSTILSVAKETPGLAEALIQIHNGATNVDVEAVIKAAADHTSIEVARNKLDELAAQRKSQIVVDAETAEANRKLEETRKKQEDMQAPPAMFVDADTTPANTKLDETKVKAEGVGLLRPLPIIDALNDPANTKLDDTQKKLDGVAQSKPNPFVDATTGTADTKLFFTKGFLDNIGTARPNPTVSAIDNASGVLQGIINMLNGITNKRFTVTTEYLTSGSPVHGAGQVIAPAANGAIFKNFSDRMVKTFANGGIENHVAQIQRAGGPVRIWAEPETKAEAYIPYAQAKRPRSLAILSQVAKDFGYELSKATDSFSSGGFAGHAGPSTTNSASVSIGNLYTVDADEAVRKIRNSQQDALAVAGITLNGA